MLRSVLLLSLLLSTPALLASDFKVGERLQDTSTSKPGAFREVSWDDLLPKDWDPLQPLKGLQLDKLKDSDPRAVEALEKLRQAWDVAPANHAMQGARIRIAGFMVPLEWSKGEVREFLLVPYFGACIHVPPPPANQIIHVVSDTPFKSKDGMDAVWVNGTLEVANRKTDMGNAGYRLKAQRVEEYKGPRN
jgi:hypothetical protein